MQINPTQIAGLMGFGSAALFSLAAWRSVEPPRHLWLTIALLYVAMTLEVLMGGRFYLEAYLKTILLSFEVYGERRGVQGFVIGLTVVGALIVMWRVARAARYLPSQVGLALCVVLLVIFLFGIETVSLHDLDQVLYRPVGPVLVIGWIWAICGIAGTWAAAMRLRE